MVVAVSGTTVTLRASTGQLSAVLVTHLVDAADFQVMDEPRTVPVSPNSLLEGLGPAERERVRRLEAHLLQLDTGVMPGESDPLADERYQPSNTVEQRIAAKVIELAGTDLAVSVRQLYRLRRAYQADGAMGLVERRLRERLAGRDPLAGADERVLSALRDAMSGQATGSTISRKTMFIRVRSVLAAAHGDAVPVPSDRELYRWAALLDRAAAQPSPARGSPRSAGQR